MPYPPPTQPQAFGLRKELDGRKRLEGMGRYMEGRPHWEGIEEVPISPGPGGTGQVFHTGQGLERTNHTGKDHAHWSSAVSLPEEASAPCPSGGGGSGLSQFATFSDGISGSQVAKGRCTATFPLETWVSPHFIIC